MILVLSIEVSNVSVETLFSVAREVTGKDAARHHYLLNAYRKGLKNYRLISSGELLKHGLLKKGALPEYVQRFVSDHGEVMLIANMIAGTPASLVIRSLKEKDFIGYGQSKGLFYGLGDLSPDFKYGDWIVLVEGTLDRDAILDIYPNVLATLSASLSILQYEILETLTNRVILLFDNDESGRKGAYTVKKKLYDRKIVYRQINHPPNVKDTGEIAELLAKGKHFDYDARINYYRQWIDNITLS